jgi:hypothetical protein
MKYAFTNADNIVVNCISGALTAAQQEMFLRDYSALFGAVAIVAVEPDTSVWIGGAYLDGVFAPPPQPEPETVEGTSEVIEEPVAMIEETTPDPQATEPEL